MKGSILLVKSLIFGQQYHRKNNIINPTIRFLGMVFIVPQFQLATVHESAAIAHVKEIPSVSVYLIEWDINTHFLSHET